MPQLNQPIRHLFQVNDLAGFPVLGLVAANFSITLQRESGGSLVAASEVITITEEGGGLYWADYTPTAAAGLYYGTIVHATHVVSPEAFEDAIIGPGAVSGPYLTTLERVKQQLFAGDSNPPTNLDTLLTTIIAEVTYRIRAMLDNRLFSEQAHVEYVDGPGTPSLRLANGPLVSVSRIDLVTYTDVGDGTRQETLEEIKPYRWVPRGLRDEGHLGKGRVELLAACWLPGQRNYKVTYVAGFDPLPAFIVEVATKEVLTEARHDPQASRLKIGDYEISTPRQEDRDLALHRALLPLMDFSLA